MKEIQEEAKRRFPIGCYFIRANENDDDIHQLEKDYVTYKISGNDIYANSGNGCLYIEGKWATLVDEDGNIIPENTTSKNINYEIY